MIEEKEMTKSEIALVKKLKEFCKEFDLVLGVSMMCKGNEASDEMLKYIDNHENLTISDILNYADKLCNKFNPELIVNE